MISRLINAGMDAARLNFSHGDHGTHRQYIENIREASVQTGKIVTVIQDLSGPKIRIGEMQNEETLVTAGARIRITGEDIPGTAELISVTYKGIFDDVKYGEQLLVDDGKIRLQVTDVNREMRNIDCEVLVGGVLRSRKGLNLPDTNLTLQSLTDKDRDDIAFGLRSGVDIIAMSFVRTASDIHMLKETIRHFGAEVPVIAKIERKEAVERIDEIIQATDMVMVARGDMGVEISPEDVPVIQKMIIHKCNEKIKPVITATQMLESMITSPTPTRAEASDVANAILDGTDCVMLSAETSTGAYPVIAVETMCKIIGKSETLTVSRYFKDIFVEDSPENTLHTICNSAVEIATRVNAKAIITITHTGKSPLLLSNHRPSSMIISATYEDRIMKMCKLIWGVESVSIEDSKSLLKTIGMIRKKLTEKSILNKGDRVVFITSIPFASAESANMLQVASL